MTDEAAKVISEAEAYWGNVEIGQIVDSPPVVVWQNDPFSTVAAAFAEHHVMYVCVVNERDELVGTISHQFLYRTQAPRRSPSEGARYDASLIVDGDTFYTKAALDSYITRQVMNRDPFCMEACATLRSAVQHMNTLNIGCIPIVNDRRNVLGVLTHRDVVNYLARTVALSDNAYG
jgi:CBS domain-containing protein